MKYGHVFTGKLVGHHTGNATFTGTDGEVIQLHQLRENPELGVGIYDAVDERGAAVTVEDGEEEATVYYTDSPRGVAGDGPMA